MTFKTLCLARRLAINSNRLVSTSSKPTASRSVIRLKSSLQRRQPSLRRSMQSIETTRCLWQASITKFQWSSRRHRGPHATQQRLSTISPTVASRFLIRWNTWNAMLLLTAHLVSSDSDFLSPRNRGRLWQSIPTQWHWVKAGRRRRRVVSGRERILTCRSRPSGTRTSFLDCHVRIHPYQISPARSWTS